MKAIYSVIATMILATNISYATNLHTVIAPTCLLKKTTIDATILASSNSLSLATIKHDDIARLAEAKSMRSETPCGGFKDITDEWQSAQLNSTDPTVFLNERIAEKTPVNNQLLPPVYKIKHEAEVNAMLKNIIAENIWSDLTTLTQLKDRYGNSPTGVGVPKTIKAKLLAIANSYDRHDIDILTVQTGNEYKQPSLVLKIGKSDKPGIVIGAHMDTLESGEYTMPGADDDGSGSSTVLEVARVLLGSKLTFDRPIYIIWYSAEEMGLVGSKYVTRYFKKNNIPVKAVLQMDLTGYRDHKDPTMWLITDYTNLPLTNYLETLITTYVKEPVKRTSCGYACSDHASWTDIGVPSSFPVETKFGKEDPYIHTSEDTMNHLTLEHMVNFAKLGIAFATELADPVDRN